MSTTTKQLKGSAYLSNFRNSYLDENELQKPTSVEAEVNAQRTQFALDVASGKRPATTTQESIAQLTAGQSQYIKYTPATQNAIGHNSGGKQRLVKMHQVQKDPLAPSGFR